MAGQDVHRPAGGNHAAGAGAGGTPPPPNLSALQDFAAGGTARGALTATGAFLAQQQGLPAPAWATGGGACPGPPGPPPPPAAGAASTVWHPDTALGVAPPVS